LVLRILYLQRYSHTSMIYEIKLKAQSTETFFMSFKLQAFFDS